MRRNIHCAVERVIEDTPEKVIGADGQEEYGSIEYGGPNPNGFEVDNLYRKSCVFSKVTSRCRLTQLYLAVDMNGIVHPCTHPEGKVKAL